MILTTLGTFAASYTRMHAPYYILPCSYFSQVEKKESPGLINKIEQINQAETNQEDKPKF